MKIKRVLLWCFLLLFVILIIVLVALTMIAPDNVISATCINLLLSVKQIFIFYQEFLWLTITFVILLFGVAMYRITSAQRGRKAHAKEWAEEQNLTESVVVADTALTPQKIYDSLTEFLKNRKKRKAYFAQGTITLSNIENGVAQGIYAHRRLFTTPDMFKVALTFQPLGYENNRVFLEIVEWEECNGVAARNCLKGMKGFIKVFNDVLLQIDPQAKIETYRR